MVDKLYQERLSNIRDFIARSGIDAYLLPVGDAFLSEYPPESAKRLEWLTGFTGSAGTVLVSEDLAVLFTDGRYMLQAEQQLDMDAYTVVNVSDLSIGQWLASNMAEKRVGYDPLLFSYQRITALESAVAKVNAVMIPLKQNPIDKVWRGGRAAMPSSPMEPHDMRYSGVSSHSKRITLCAQMAKEGVDALFISAPDSVAWLLNIRGRDVSTTPLILCQALLIRKDDQPEGEVTLFLDPGRVDSEGREHLGSYTALESPDALPSVLESIGRREELVIQIDPILCSAYYVQLLEKEDAKLRLAHDPCQRLKAAKNAVELAGMRTAHILDGAALARFLHWMEIEGGNGTYTEYDLGKKLEQFRAESSDYICASFDTIAGFGANGAVVHYRAIEGDSKYIMPDGLLLVDSGGQYRFGTTDVTRTIVIGQPTREQRQQFTRVLRGHIALARARFPAGTSGTQLDVLARQPLWQEGFDYDHGTGHGVGSYLGVHEGPQRISKRGGDIALVPGMVLSNEPGYYKTGEYGIRIENLVAVIENSQGEAGPFYGFETLTLAPIDRRLIDPSQLSNAEIDWLDAYHARVWDVLSDEIADPATKEWLSQVTRPL